MNLNQEDTQEPAVDERVHITIVFGNKPEACAWPFVITLGLGSYDLPELILFFPERVDPAVACFLIQKLAVKVVEQYRSADGPQDVYTLMNDSDFSTWLVTLTEDNQVLGFSTRKMTKDQSLLCTTVIFDHLSSLHHLERVRSIHAEQADVLLEKLLKNGFCVVYPSDANGTLPNQPGYDTSLLPPINSAIVH